MSLGWSLQETQELFKTVAQSGNSLNSAFRAIAQKYNRKPNSVRNYYYSQLKAFSLLPDVADRLGISPQMEKRQFETFAEEEITSLVKQILIQQAQGRSVRSIVLELANGNKTVMLRLQNKYRAVIASKRGRLNSILHQLDSSGATYRHPISGEIVQSGISKAVDTPMVDDLRKLIEHALRQIESLQLANTQKAQQIDKLHADNLNKSQQLDRLHADNLNKSQQLDRLQSANSALAAKILALSNTPK